MVRNYFKIRQLVKKVTLSPKLARRRLYAKKFEIGQDHLISYGPYESHGSYDMTHVCRTLG